MKPLGLGLTVLLAALPVFAADDAADANLLKRAEQIQKRILAFDSHLDLPFDYTGAAEDGKTQFDLPKAFRGHLKGAALAVFVPQGPRTPEGYAKARDDAEKKYNLIKAVAEANPSRAAIAYSGKLGGSTTRRFEGCALETATSAPPSISMTHGSGSPALGASSVTPGAASIPSSGNRDGTKPCDVQDAAVRCPPSGDAVSLVLGV